MRILSTRISALEIYFPTINVRQLIYLSQQKILPREFWNSLPFFEWNFLNFHPFVPFVHATPIASPRLNREFNPLPRRENSLDPNSCEELLIKRSITSLQHSSGPNAARGNDSESFNIRYPIKVWLIGSSWPTTPPPPPPPHAYQPP